MTALFVIQFLALLWAAGLSIGLALVAGQCRDTRRSVMAAFKGNPNVLNLSPHPVSIADAARITRENATPTPPRGTAAVQPVRGPDDIVAPPPTVRGDTVRDWLRHFTNRDNMWDDVVAEFYARAAEDPLVAPYFTDVDLPRLQRHFVATMVMVTNTGLTARAVQRITVAHAEVRNPAGVPITGTVYDRVVDVLVTVLVEHGVPDPAINELKQIIDPLRAAIVAIE